MSSLCRREAAVEFCAILCRNDQHQCTFSLRVGLDPRSLADA
jgi:hypothetical protein